MEHRGRPCSELCPEPCAGGRRGCSTGCHPWGPRLGGGETRSRHPGSDPSPGPRSCSGGAGRGLPRGCGEGPAVSLLRPRSRAGSPASALLSPTRCAPEVGPGGQRTHPPQRPPTAPQGLCSPACRPPTLGSGPRPPRPSTGTLPGPQRPAPARVIRNHTRNAPPTPGMKPHGAREAPPAPGPPPGAADAPGPALLLLNTPPIITRGATSESRGTSRFCPKLLLKLFLVCAFTLFSQTLGSQESVLGWGWSQHRAPGQQRALLPPGGHMGNDASGGKGLRTPSNNGGPGEPADGGPSARPAA